MVLRGIKTIYRTKLSDISDTDLEGVGQVRQDGDCWYRWIRNFHTADLAVGTPVSYSMANGANFHEKVYLPTDALAATVAGLAMAAIEAYSATVKETGQKQFGWIMIEGYHGSAQCVQRTGTALAASQALIPASYDVASSSYLLGAGTIFTTYSTQPVGQAHFIALGSKADAAGTNTTQIGVLVHCLTV